MYWSGGAALFSILGFIYSHHGLYLGNKICFLDYLMKSNAHQFFKPAPDQVEDSSKMLAGHASGQDAANNFPERQGQWLTFSEGVLNELAEHMDDKGHFSMTEMAQRSGPQNDSDFEKIFRFCAKKRHEIAQTLHQQSAGHFGVFRGADEWIWEDLYGDPARGRWENVKGEVFKHVLALVSSIPEESGMDKEFELVSEPADEMFEPSPSHSQAGEAYQTFHLSDEAEEDDGVISSRKYGNEFMEVLCEEMKKGSNVEQFSFDIKFKAASFQSDVTKAAPYNDVLSSISMRYKPQDSKEDFMKIMHAVTSDEKQVGNFNIANYYYRNLLSMSTDSEENRHVFLKELGRLTYLLAHLMPLKRGSSSVCEWITKAIALKKGIRLGAFNHDEPLPWDFKAFVTPDQEVYAEWYANKAFLDITLESAESSLLRRADGGP